MPPYRESHHYTCEADDHILRLAPELDDVGKVSAVHVSVWSSIADTKPSRWQRIWWALRGKDLEGAYVQLSYDSVALMNEHLSLLLEHWGTRRWDQRNDGWMAQFDSDPTMHSISEM